MAHQVRPSTARWRDGSADKTIHCSYKAPGFNFQNLHDDSQPLVTPVPKDLACFFNGHWLLHT